ncbi:MAG: hypothetical protein GX442_14810 [Candidatus Riflebacteria bacterium]|nr:hypothetical protein [Candidatus Riflebacteria bacterium]
MRRPSGMFLFAIALLLLANSAAGADRDLSGKPFFQALTDLAREGKLNILVDGPDAPAVPFRAPAASSAVEVVTALAARHGRAAAAVGEFVVVVPQAHRERFEGRSTRVWRPAHRPVGAIREDLAPRLPATVAAVADSATNLLFLDGFPGSLDPVRHSLEALDRPTPAASLSLTLRRAGAPDPAATLSLAALLDTPVQITFRPAPATGAPAPLTVTVTPRLGPRGALLLVHSFQGNTRSGLPVHRPLELSPTGPATLTWPADRPTWELRWEGSSAAAATPQEASAGAPGTASRPATSDPDQAAPPTSGNPPRATPDQMTGPAQSPLPGSRRPVTATAPIAGAPAAGAPAAGQADPDPLLDFDWQNEALSEVLGRLVASTGSQLLCHPACLTPVSLFCHGPEPYPESFLSMLVRLEGLAIGKRGNHWIAGRPQDIFFRVGHVDRSAHITRRLRWWQAASLEALFARVLPPLGISGLQVVAATGINALVIGGQSRGIDTLRTLLGTLDQRPGWLSLSLAITGPTAHRAEGPLVLGSPRRLSTTIDGASITAELLPFPPRFPDPAATAGQAPDLHPVPTTAPEPSAVPGSHPDPTAPPSTTLARATLHVQSDQGFLGAETWVRLSDQLQPLLSGGPGPARFCLEAAGHPCPDPAPPPSGPGSFQGAASPDTGSAAVDPDDPAPPRDRPDDPAGTGSPRRSPTGSPDRHEDDDPFDRAFDTSF